MAENFDIEKMFVLNAIIKSVSLDDSDRDILCGWLHLEYSFGGQGFGGYSLYLPKSYKHHRMLSHAGHFIWRCMEIGGVRRWQDLPGKTIRVRQRTEGGLIDAIGHIVKDDWFCPRIDFAEQHPATEETT